MNRFLFALVASLTLTIATYAADLPTGKWAANVAGGKGELVITEVGKDGAVKATLFGNVITGTWRKDVLTLSVPSTDEAKARKVATLEARLVSEPAENGKIKYTLAGTKTDFQTAFPVEPDFPAELKTGWYAQITKDAPPSAALGEIKAEVRGVLVSKMESMSTSP